VTLHEALTGCHPFRGGSAAETIAAILSGVRSPLPASIPAIPPSLAIILQKAMAKDAGERYQTADALLADLKQAAVGGPSETETTWGETPGSSVGGPGTARSQRIRRSWVRASLLGVIIVAAVVAGVFWYQGRQPVLSFAARDWVLVSDFENRTGDAMFDKSLDTALTVSLSQSRHANVFPASQVGPVLKRMGKAADAAVTEQVGREVCQRENHR
jgi:serine/threonine protein kinase